MTDPSACVYHAVHELTGINAGETVLITGCGAMGLFAVQYVKANGGVPIITGLSQDARRLKIAEELGAEHIINVSESDVAQEVMTITKKQGVDTAIECSGNPKAANDCLALLRRQGKYTQVGIFGRPVTLDLDRVLYGEIQLTGSFSQKYSGWKAALELASLGKIQARPLISDILPLEEWEKGFRLSFEGKAIKVVFQPEM